jgi:hypothetical protein
MFRYPALYPPNTFEATLRDAGGLVSGIIVQPNEFFEPAGGLQHAVIEGSHDGSTLTFIKIYDDLGRVTVHYRGTILTGGNEIEGMWSIPGNWSGTFFMLRAPGAEEGVSERIAEDVER